MDALGRMIERARVTSTGCYVTDFADNGRGYALIRVGGQNKLAHRVSFEAERGAIPAGLTLDHLCRNRACINPDHLRPCSMRDNLLAPGSEALAALNSAKTACPAGHPYDDANTYVRPSRRNERECRACHREREARRRLTAV